MLWNKKHKLLYAAFMEAEKKLNEKEEYFLYPVYSAIASGDRELARRGGRALRGMLEDYSMQKWIRLGETFRQNTAIDYLVDWDSVQVKKIREWFESEEDVRCVLILGTFHPNGYFREKCLQELESCKNALPFMILRMNDWVENIRRIAAELVRYSICSRPVEELFYAAQAMDKLQRSGRREPAVLSEIKMLMEERLEQEAGNISLEEILKFDFGVRKSIYRCLFAKPILELEQAEWLLKNEKHSFCQSLIAAGIFRHYNCPMEQVDRSLTHKNVFVRKKALEYKYKIIKNAWPGMEGLLLDSNRGIRDFAVFILERHQNFDTLGFYAACLKEENPVAAITEIGARGKKGMETLIMPFLDAPKGKVVRCSLIAIGRLAGIEAADIFWSYLFDHRPSISKTAYYAASKNGARYGAKALYESIQREIKEDGKDWVKCCLLKLLNRETCWERIPYLIRLYSNRALEAWQETILEGLGNRHLYCRITAGQGQAVIQALDEYGGGLPKTLAQQIRFDLKFVIEK